MGNNKQVQSTNRSSAPNNDYHSSKRIKCCYCLTSKRPILVSGVSGPIVLQSDFCWGGVQTTLRFPGVICAPYSPHGLSGNKHPSHTNFIATFSQVSCPGAQSTPIQAKTPKQFSVRKSRSKTVILTLPPHLKSQMPLVKRELSGASRLLSRFSRDDWTWDDQLLLLGCCASKQWSNVEGVGIQGKRDM